MTILEAIKNRVNYPLSDSQAEEKLISRGLDGSMSYSQQIAQSKEFQLAYADLLRFLVTMVNLSQGGSVTAQSVQEWRGTANAIYRKYGELPIGESQSVITDMSDIW